ncbi:hypothetical protein MACK_000649 [Theileria orientalis]|uniref:Uncharacterized protein n=1 Tax=Theileria orientalis TaxID=68886 RepID=A0A976MAB1_THEOR|nr:hypothetical protein MACK_000649 [Theileria orientalis]
MDLSVKYSDLINDDSLINVLNELDEIGAGDASQAKPEEQNLPLSDQNLKAHTLSINSTRYDSDSSSVALGEEQYVKQPKQWLSYQKKFELHISKTLSPLVRYMVEAKVFTGKYRNWPRLNCLEGKHVCFTKKKSYLERLINETVEAYRHHWKRVYSSVYHGSQELTNEQSEVEKGNSLEDLDKENLKVYKGLSSFDMNSFIRSTSVLSGCETDGETTQEGMVNDVFVESGCRHELVETLYESGMEEFYNLLDFLLGMMQNTKYDYKVVQAMDLLTTMLKLMPELSVLLVIPIKKDSKLLCKGKCYFKYLVDKLKVRFGLNKGSVLEVYKKFLKQEFVPFYMNNPYGTLDSGGEKLEEKDMETDNENGQAPETSKRDELAVVYALDRLISLVGVLSERLFEFTNMKIEEELKSTLLKKVKKFLFLPVLGVGILHELFLPFSGDFRFGEVKRVGYRSLIAKYLYTPPPLYALRLRVLEVLEMLTGSDLVKYRGNFHKANRRLTESDSVSGMAQKVDKVLVNHLHLLSFGASFLLMGEFMKKSVENPETFFGSYLALMPHFRINFAQMNDKLVVEENVYRIQRSALNVLSNLNESGVFTNEDFMNIRCVNLTQSNTLKRMLSLLVHYVSNTTETEIEEAEMDLNVDNEFNIHKAADQSCSKYCDLIVPYNTSTIATYLMNVNSRQERRVSSSGTGTVTNHDDGRMYGNMKVDAYNADQNRGDRYERRERDDRHQNRYSIDDDIEDDDCSMFYYNDYNKLSTMQVDVCIYEEFDKIMRHALNPSSYYIPLEHCREVKYKLSDRPLLEFRTRPISSGNKLGGTRTGNVLLTSNGFSIHTDYMRSERSSVNSMIDRESTIEVDDMMVNSDDDTTNREDSMERGPTEDCGHVCLLKKHMVYESRVKEVLQLRKQLVIQILEALSIHPSEKLGELEPLYNSFIMKLMC